MQTYLFYTVNSYYNATSNEIVFPAGILQTPFYDIKAPKEANLGGIGTIIAHEITHAFDNNGAKFDENGNAANWWAESDYQKFEELCDEVVRHYDGYETAPCITINGTLTLSENIADLGGMACALDAMKKIDSRDYDVFFKNNAKIWEMTCTRQYLEYVNQMDVHSSNKARTNKVIQNFDEFYQTYGITKIDGMYSDNRVSIW
jgi:putative endopeptidase